VSPQTVTNTKITSESIRQSLASPNDRAPKSSQNNDNWIKEVGTLCDEIIHLNDQMHSKLKIIKEIKLHLFADKVSKFKIAKFISRMIEEIDNRICEYENFKVQADERRKSEMSKVFRLMEAKNRLNLVYEELMAPAKPA
jgi:phosphorylcholine metabolism protein LicD